MIGAGELRVQLAYSSWASRLLLDAAAQLTAEELTRDFGTADRSVLGTLVHIFAADRMWLGRVQGNPPARFLDPATDLRLDALQTAWPALGDRWTTWAAGLTDDAAQSALAYRDLRGNPWETPTWQIVLHVVNHATHHRGQVSGFLRSMGKTPPPLDLIAYYRRMSPL